MEHKITQEMLEYMQSKFEEMKAENLRLIFCIDGDVGLYKQLMDNQLVDDICRDLAHVLKNIPKNMSKKLGQGELATYHAQHAKSWMASCIRQGWDQRLPNDVARKRFLNYTQHHSNKHGNCNSDSPCTKPGWRPDPKYSLEDKPAVASQIQDILATSWREDAVLITDMRTSNCENMNPQATQYHDKRKDLPASWVVRDGAATATSQVIISVINTASSGGGRGV